MLKILLSLILAICTTCTTMLLRAPDASDGYTAKDESNMVTEAYSVTTPSSATEGSVDDGEALPSAKSSSRNRQKLHLYKPEDAYEQEWFSDHANGDIMEAHIGETEVSGPEVSEQEVYEPEVDEPESSDCKEAEIISDKSAELSGDYATEAEINYGSAGRLYIPDANISVAINWCSLDTEGETAQIYTDWEDSAAYFLYGSTLLIADHNNQSFAELHTVYPGCAAYIDDHGERTSYVCTEVTRGYNLGYELETEDGRRIRDCDNSFVTYTCYNGWQNIIIAFWDASA